MGAWVLVSHLDVGPGVGNKPTLAPVCLRQNTGQLLSVWLWKVDRLWVLAGLGIGGAAKKNADSMRAGFHVFPHGWSLLPGMESGTLQALLE